jgi:Tol biopolymer transport system component
MNQSERTPSGLESPATSVHQPAEIIVIPTYRRLQMAAALLAVLGTACSDAPSAPRSGTVRVSVRTSGGDPDFDGYEVVVDPARRSIATNGTAEFRYIGVGTHSVVLDGVADNCTVTATPVRSVTVKPNQTVDVPFDVECATTGIAITMQTSGVDIPDTVDVFVNNESFSPIPANGSSVAGGFRPGKYTVTLVLPGINCSVTGGDEVTVDEPARTVVPVLFAVTCAAPVRSEQIAFAADTTIGGAPAAVIEVIEPDGSGGRVIGRGGEPSWSPEGVRVVFADAHCEPILDDPGVGCFGALTVMDPELGRLTPPPDASGAFSPAWAPAGDAIAYVGCCDAGLEPGRLFVVGLDGSSRAEIVIPEVRSVRHPAWSPDGQRIAFTCIIDGFPPERFDGDLCVVDRDGSRFEQLTADPTSESAPAWSPDGTRIAFSRGTDIALFNLDDGVVTRLTEGREPAWSPDGSTLVFAGGDGLFTIRADGTNRRRLTSGRHRAPAWRP